MSFKVGDKVLWFDGYDEYRGVVVKVNKKSMSIKWDNFLAVLEKPWTLDGKWGGPESDGTVCVRLLTPLEELL